MPVNAIIRNVQFATSEPIHVTFSEITHSCCQERLKPSEIILGLIGPEGVGIIDGLVIHGLIFLHTPCGLWLGVMDDRVHHRFGHALKKEVYRRVSGDLMSPPLLLVLVVAETKLCYDWCFVVLPCWWVWMFFSLRSILLNSCVM